LYQPTFVHAYVQDPNFIYTDFCLQEYGIPHQQIQHDVSWLWGVLQTTILNPNLPEFLAASSDGVLALHYLSQAYTNSGETAEEHVEILRLTYVKHLVHGPQSNLADFTTMMMIKATVLQILKIQPYFTSNSVILRQYKTNLENSAVPLSGFLYDQIDRGVHWLHGIQHAISRAPSCFRSTGIQTAAALPSPAHIFQAIQSPSPPSADDQNLHLVGSDQELTTYVSKVYSHHLTNLRRTVKNKNDASLIALTQTYATFKHAPTTLNLSIPADIRKHLDDSMRKQINRICQEVLSEKLKSSTTDNSSKPSTPIGNQYPTMNSTAPKDADIEAAINAVYNFAQLELSDDESTGTVDDDFELFSANMIAVDHDDVSMFTVDQYGLLVDPVSDADIVCDCTKSFRRANHFCLMKELQQYVSLANLCTYLTLLDVSPV